jgi:hypothetical protein
MLFHPMSDMPLFEFEKVLKDIELGDKAHEAIDKGSGKNQFCV